MKKLLLIITVSLLAINVNAQGPNLEIYPGSKTVAPGATFDVSFTVKELHQIVQINGSITWDPNVIQFDTVSYFGLPYMTAGTFNTNSASSGTLTWMWQHLISIGGTLADGDSIFNIRFTAVGTPGQQSTITLGNAPVPLYWFNFSAWTGSINSSPGQITLACGPGAEPTAGFSHSATQLAVNFSDNSTNNPHSWYWDFGDGSSDTTKNPMHTYAMADTFTVCLIATNVCGSDTNCTDVIVDLTTVIDNISNKYQIKIYPNPVTDIVHIASDNKFDSVRLINALGKEVFTEVHANTVSVSHLASGYYQIVFNDGSHSYRHGLLIKR